MGVFLFVFDMINVLIVSATEPTTSRGSVIVVSLVPLISITVIPTVVAFDVLVGRVSTTLASIEIQFELSAVQLEPVEILHRVFGILRVVEFDVCVTETFPIVILLNPDVIDLSIALEELIDVMLFGVKVEVSDVQDF